jgi:hypothetical protein
MPPRTRAKAKFAKIEADIASTNGTFDVDESVAAQVFSHVTNVRDHLALSCVSRVWRKVAASDGAWGTCELVIDAKLGKRLTDDRFGNLIRYCGDVKHLEVHDAHSLSSPGGYFLPVSSLAKSFGSLETVKLTNCSNLTSSSILAFMKAIGVLDRPKEDRLRCMRLAGCDMQAESHLAELNECLGITQREIFFERRNGQDDVQVRHVASVINQSSFDLWPCLGNTYDCDCVAGTSEEVSMCNSCLDTFCNECYADYFGTRD